MQKVLLYVLLLFCFSSFSQKQNLAIKRVLLNMNEQVIAWNAGDITGFMNYYWNSDSLKFIGSKGVTYGWQKTLDNYLKNYPDKTSMGRLKFTILSSEQLSKTSVYVIGKWELEKDKPTGGHFTLLWKKINKRWLIVADHTS